MPRQRNHYPRPTCALPEDFPQRLERFKEVAGLSWRELARHLRISPVTLWRWRKGVGPHPWHLRALYDLADELGLLGILTTGTTGPGGLRERRRSAGRIQSPAGEQDDCTALAPTTEADVPR